ncbi:MAG: hypothetical protein HFE30_06005 [Clostridiales bacterium]|nr:hypothetical protein [Clostridiales bacterium]
MPYIEIKTNIDINVDKRRELTAILGERITVFPGKTERWLMTSVTGGLDMTFAGSDEPCIMAQVSIFGSAKPETYEKMTAVLCEELSSALGVDGSRIYVKYEECSLWGWNGANF